MPSASGCDAHVRVQDFRRHAGPVRPDERFPFRMHTELPKKLDVEQRFEHLPVHRVREIDVSRPTIAKSQPDGEFGDVARFKHVVFHAFTPARTISSTTAMSPSRCSIETRRRASPRESRRRWRQGFGSAGQSSGSAPREVLRVVARPCVDEKRRLDWLMTSQFGEPCAP